MQRRHVLRASCTGAVLDQGSAQTLEQRLDGAVAGCWIARLGAVLASTLPKATDDWPKMWLPEAVDRAWDTAAAACMARAERPEAQLLAPAVYESVCSVLLLLVDELGAVMPEARPQAAKGPAGNCVEEVVLKHWREVRRGPDPSQRDGAWRWPPCLRPGTSVQTGYGGGGRVCGRLGPRWGSCTAQDVQQLPQGIYAFPMSMCTACQ